MLETIGSDAGPIALTSVLYVSETVMNLPYLSKTMKKGVKFDFAGQSCRMLKDGRLLAEATLSCGIYGIESASANDAHRLPRRALIRGTCFLDTWAMTIVKLARLAAGSIMPGMTTTAAEGAAGQEACDICITAK